MIHKYISQIYITRFNQNLELRENLLQFLLIILRTFFANILSFHLRVLFAPHFTTAVNSQRTGNNKTGRNTGNVSRKRDSVIEQTLGAFP